MSKCPTPATIIVNVCGPIKQIGGVCRGATFNESIYTSQALYVLQQVLNVKLASLK